MISKTETLRSLLYADAAMTLNTLENETDLELSYRAIFAQRKANYINAVRNLRIEVARRNPKLAYHENNVRRTRETLLASIDIDDRYDIDGNFKGSTGRGLKSNGAQSI